MRLAFDAERGHTLIDCVEGILCWGVSVYSVHKMLPPASVFVLSMGCD